MLSDPTKEDSDGDGIVDARDAQPLEAFDDRFYIDSKLRPAGTAVTAIYNLQKESDERYATKKVGDDGVSADRLVNIATRARLNSGALVAGMTNCVRFLNHFLNNTGNTIYYDAKKLTQKTANGYYNYAQNMNVLRDLCESTVVDDLYFNMKYQNLLPGVQFSDIGGDTTLEKDWWYAIGNASATASIHCKKSGDLYTADVVYQILDFYDWEDGSEARGGFVTDGEMAILHIYGEAKEMATVGEYTTSFNWKKGERLNTELK